mgnify:CR=1 FL=1
MNSKNSCAKKKNSTGLMIKLFFVVILLSTTLLGHSQVQFGVGFSMGYNKSFDGTTGPGLYRRMPLENKNNFPDYNFGADGILKIKDWLRVKAELHYSNLGFTRYWNPDLSNPGTGDIKRIQESKVAVSYMDFSPKAELRFLKLGNFDAYASLGFQFEFKSGKWEKTTTLEGRETDDDYVLDDFNKSQSGVVGGLLLKYNITPNWAVTLSPSYTYFFDPLIFQNDYDHDIDTWLLNLNKYDLKRYTVNIGVEYLF